MKLIFPILIFCITRSAIAEGQDSAIDDKSKDAIAIKTSNSLYVLECLRNGVSTDDINERLKNKLLSEAIYGMLSDAKSLSEVRLLHSSVVANSAIALNDRIATRMILKDAELGLLDDNLSPYTCLCLKILLDHARDDLPNEKIIDALTKGRVNNAIIKGSSLELVYYFRALESSAKTLGLGAEQKKFIDGYLQISEKWEKDTFGIHSILNDVIKSAKP